MTSIAAIGVGIVVWAEWMTWRASRDGLPNRPGPGPQGTHGQIVVVPGAPSRPDGRPGPMQKWRCRIAVRSANSVDTRFLFCGGPSHAGHTEAAVMARYAITKLGLPPTNVLLEEASRTTWENIFNALPLLETATSIVIASNTFHARRARRYLATQRPDLADRLRRGRDWMPGELAPLKPWLVLYEWRRSRLARGQGWT
ncbi:MAG TPA: YdcF family protein [Lacisediminihabitans sp.]|uniref:YdcF family protein n=1 Tax=Lacisediminihabitans sp. TaxID=2787631 RepID=UPI002ED7DA2B